MTKTKREIVSNALRMLGVWPLHGDEDAEEYELAAGYYDSLFAALDDVHEVGVSFTSNAVPDWAYLPLSQMTAGAVAQVFGMADQSGYFRVGLRDMRRYAANENRVDGRPVKTVYF